MKAEIIRKKEIKIFNESGFTFDIKNNCKVNIFWMLHLTSKRGLFLHIGIQNQI